MLKSPLSVTVPLNVTSSGVFTVPVTTLLPSTVKPSNGLVEPTSPVTKIFPVACRCRVSGVVSPLPSIKWDAELPSCICPEPFIPAVSVTSPLILSESYANISAATETLVDMVVVWPEPSMNSDASPVRFSGALINISPPCMGLIKCSVSLSVTGALEPASPMEMTLLLVRLPTTISLKSPCNWLSALVLNFCV